ncbi:hypothetical protein HAX54_050785 [Datura stramonium]|uniref:SHSP domain-containing protein n=1 Tax=Datura stramonium TaxID=4076 RepID=A0ABS8WLR1_DATST|nr:hypothetical protein [Datura stramonium]
MKENLAIEADGNNCRILPSIMHQIVPIISIKEKKERLCYLEMVVVGGELELISSGWSAAMRAREAAEPSIVVGTAVAPPWGLKPHQVRVKLEDENMLVVSRERKKEKEKEDQERIKYLRMERQFNKLLKKFMLPENAITDAISATFQDGVLLVTVEKLPPPEPKKSKVIEVKLRGGEDLDEFRVLIFYYFFLTNEKLEGELNIYC